MTLILASVSIQASMYAASQALRPICATLFLIFATCAGLLLVSGAISAAHRYASGAYPAQGLVGILGSIGFCLALILAWSPFGGVAIFPLGLAPPDGAVDVAMRTLALRFPHGAMAGMQTMLLRFASADGNAWQLLGHPLQTIFGAICFGVANFAAVIMQVVYGIRYVLMDLIWVVGPWFISALALPSTRSIGVTFLTQAIGVYCWPLGFAFVDTVTIALLSHIAADPNALDPFTFSALMLFVACWVIIGYIAGPMILGAAMASGTIVSGGMALFGAATGGAAVVGGAAAGAALGAAGAGLGAMGAAGTGLGSAAAGLAGGAASQLGGAVRNAGANLGQAAHQAGYLHTHVPSLGSPSFGVIGGSRGGGGGPTSGGGGNPPPGGGGGPDDPPPPGGGSGGGGNPPPPGGSMMNYRSPSGSTASGRSSGAALGASSSTPPSGASSAAQQMSFAAPPSGGSGGGSAGTGSGESSAPESASPPLAVAGGNAAPAAAAAAEGGIASAPSTVGGSAAGSAPTIAAGGSGMPGSSGGGGSIGGGSAVSVASSAPPISSPGSGAGSGAGSAMSIPPAGGYTPPMGFRPHSADRVIPPPGVSAEQYAANINQAEELTARAMAVPPAQRAAAIQALRNEAKI